MKIELIAHTPENTPSPYSYGLDEAGRGCLAGPVVAAIVLFSPATDWNDLDGLDDSKKLSASKRAALVPHILKQAAAYGIGLSWQKEIDEINIINATFRAMCRAILLMQRKFSPLPNAPAFVDGNLLIRQDAWEYCASIPAAQWHLPYFPLFPSPHKGQANYSQAANPHCSSAPCPPKTGKSASGGLIQSSCRDTQKGLREFPFPRHKALVGGDGLLPAIAAASILAKTTRDSLMERLDARFPQYGFGSHKGYGTRKHREAIRQKGPCILHRHTFMQKILKSQEQLPLFRKD